MECGISHRNILFETIAVVLLALALLVIVSESSDTAEATKTVTFDPDGGILLVDGVDCSDDSSRYLKRTSVRGWRDTTLTMVEADDYQNNVHYEYYLPGYLLDGWSRNQTGSNTDTYKGNTTYSSNGTTYSPGNNVSYSDYNTPDTLYAVWKKCTITFDSNGGTVKDPNGHTLSNYKYKTGDGLLSIPGSTIVTSSQTYIYSRTNCVLAGWSTDAGAVFVAGDPLPVLNDDLTLRAIWKQVVTVTYLPNGGSSVYYVGDNPNPQSGNYSFSTYQDISIPGNVFTVENTRYEYTWTGHTFMGWSYNNKTYVLGDVLETGSTNINLSAVWVSNSMIIFDPNGGVASPGLYTPIADNGSLYVPGSTFTINDGVNTTKYTYSKSGHTFVGWSTNKYSTSAEYVKGNILESVGTGYVLYAVWKIDTNKVTFIYGDGYTAEVEIKYGYTFDSTSYMNYVPRGMEAYKIVGWATESITGCDQDTAGAYILPDDITTYSRKISLPSLEDLELYPIWGLKVSAPAGSASLKLDSSVQGSSYEGCYYINGQAAANGIVVVGGSPHLFIDNVVVDFSSKSNGNYSASTTYSPFILESQADVTLTVISDCGFYGASNIKSGNYYLGYAGINVKSGTYLTISKDSVGKLTAVGGGAKSTVGSWGSSDVDGRTGAGIGSNGSSSSSYNDGCGYIIINGGIVSAYGGDGYIEGSSSGWGGTSFNNDIVLSHGIGGNTTADGSEVKPITISGGKVTAATGHVTKSDGYVPTSSDVKYRRPIYDGTADNVCSNTEISNNARVV